MHVLPGRGASGKAATDEVHWLSQSMAAEMNRMSCGGGFCLGPSAHSPPGSATCCQADDGTPGSPMATERRMSNGSMGGSPQVLRGIVISTHAALRVTTCLPYYFAPDAAGF